MIDIGSYAVSKLGLGSPSSSVDILRRLESHGHLDEGSTDRFTPIFGFRNRVVHPYDRVDPQIVYQILTQERADLEGLLGLLLKTLGHDAESR